MVDYSRWNNIEISDDEDDTHPNIDTGSLFRWRHQARLERMEKHRQAKEELEMKEKKINEKMAEINLKTDDNEKLKILEEKRLLEKEIKDMERKERLQPWNVDTISHDSWSKTLINRNCLQEDPNYSGEAKEIDDEHAKRYANFIKNNESKIRDFAFYSRFSDSQNFLLQNSHLVCQHTLDYMLLWCLQLKIDEKISLLDHVAKQAVILQMILDLSKTVPGSDPRDCLATFFSKSKINWTKFQQLWEDEINDFKQRVNTAAEMRIERAIKEQMESNEKLIGPGGLDAQEVFESLPPELQECFERRDVEMLQEKLSQMDPEQAEYYMQRCVDGGLWDVNKKPDEDEILLQKITKQTANQNEENNASENEDYEQSD